MFHHQTMSSTKINLPLLFLSHLLLLKADSKCQESFPCRNFSIEFPFTDIKNPECGLFSVNCTDTYTYPKLYLGTRDFPYDILQKVSPNKFIIKDSVLENYFSRKSCLSFGNVSLPQSPFVSFTFSPNLTSFTCFEQRKDIEDYFAQFKNKTCDNRIVYYKTPAIDHVPTTDHVPPDCVMNELPIKSAVQEYFGDLLDLLTPNLSLEWHVSEACLKCYREGGQCLATRTNELYCSPNSPGSNRTLVLAITIPVAAILIFLVAGFILWQRKKKTGEAYLLSRNLSYDPSSKSDIEDGSFNFGIPIFSYTELVDATCNFDPSKELGDGGFGTVYYGKLRDGREVAIKRLYEHNYRRVEQFLNEIKILTSLRHPNLVSLYGCTSRKSRELLLVYEYIPNGTVADHLHGERAKESPLTWQVRMNIARETAAALAYLHKSVIVHRDVKTNNILLDSNFSVKVADFGLSRLFPTNVTHISTAPQGTPGYVDPEYHQCYQLTDKSDVYSFGVVLIELISSMPAVDISRHKHEINLANLAVKKIQRCAFDELIDPSIGYNSDDEVTRMTTSVAELAFRCLQLEKDMRPSMEEVVAFLHDIQTGRDCDFEQGKEGGDKGNHKQIPPSPETDEAVLLKSKIYQSSSPVAVTDTWISGSSTTASSVG